MFFLKWIWKRLDKLLFMCPMFVQHWIYHISNLKLKCTTIFINNRSFFAMCLNGSIYSFSLMNVLSRRHVWNWNISNEGISYIWLFFISEMMSWNFGMKPKTNLITFEKSEYFLVKKNCLIKMCVCVKLATGLWSVSKLWGGGVPNLDSDPSKT